MYLAWILHFHVVIICLITIPEFHTIHSFTCLVAIVAVYCDQTGQIMIRVEFRDGDIANYYHVEMEDPSKIHVLDLSAARAQATTVGTIVLD
jgi:hypothetical protein